MTLFGKLRLSEETRLRLLEGEPDEVQARLRAIHDAKLRPARLEIARRNRRWHELQEVDLVARHRGWLVSATTDEIFSPYRGAVWVPDSVAVVSDMAELWFYVTADDEIHFLERVNPPATYTQWLEAQAAKELRKAAPKPRRVPT
jgi:hypothetical protein